MATAAKKVEPAAVDHSKILKEVADNAVIVLTDPVKLEQYLAALRAEVEANPGTIDTASGRDIIRSNAADIGKKKSALEKVRLSKTEEWRSLTAAVNAAGKVVKERFQALQDEVRAPLTAWEEKEEARKSEAQAIIDDMLTSSVVSIDDTSESIQERLDRVRGRNLSDEMFGPRIMEVTDLRDSTVSTLLAAVDRLKKEEADKAELQRLRDAEAARAKEDAERRAKEEADAAAAEQAKRDAELEEQRKADAAAQIERERKEAAEKAQRDAEEAARKATRDAEEKAQREQEERDRAAQAEIDAANARALAAQQQAAADRAMAVIRECAMGAIDGRPAPWPAIIAHLQDSVDVSAESLGKSSIEATQLLHRAIEHARNELATQIEAERKQQDQKHRTACKTAAKEAIIAIGIPEAKAVKLVQAIVAGDIPRVTLAF
jgi:Membrane protein involved in colicin uptake